MGDFKSFKCDCPNMRITGLYEKNLTPLEMIFNLKFGIEVIEPGLKIPEEEFYDHLRGKIGLFEVERELLQMTWPVGWSFKPWNTRYTYEHSWQAVRQRIKPSRLGMDIALTAPDELRPKHMEKQLRTNFLTVGQQISEMACFRPSEYIRLIR